MSIDQYRNKIISGDALTVLHQLPDESVHCVITSPPYWGLRKYEGEEQDQVWGGSKDCEHEWGAEIIAKSKDSNRGDMTWTTGGSPSSKILGIHPSQGQFCVRCGAWRGQLGLEPTPDLYVQHLVEVFREVKRVLRSDGTLWLNMGDSYASNWGAGANRKSSWWSTASGESEGKGWGDVETAIPPNMWRKHPTIKPKDLIGIPWRVAFALQADRWYLRSDIIWSKPNPMPESVQDRPTKSHEYVFLLAKSPQYFYDADAIREEVKPESPQRAKYPFKPEVSGSRYWHQEDSLFHPPSSVRMNPAGRNKRSVWTIPTQPYAGAHFAVFPEALVEPMVKAGTSEKGCCVKCGAPWEKIVKIDQIRHRKPWKDTKHPNGRNTEQLASWAAQYGSTTKVTTPIGWEPTCNCNTDTKPCIVLDPFVGSGTTCLVAAKLNRDWIGIDVSEKYCAMARERLAPYATKLEAFAS